MSVTVLASGNKKRSKRAVILLYSGEYPGQYGCADCVGGTVPTLQNFPSDSSMFRICACAYSDIEFTHHIL